jgi:hypothetical protein
MTEVELEQIKESIDRLETKMDMLLAQQRRPRFLWKEFLIGFGVVFVIMVVYFSIVQIIQSHG